MSVSDEPRPEELAAEGEGDTLGEAKWAAMKALEPRFPGISANGTLPRECPKHGTTPISASLSCTCS